MDLRPYQLECLQAIDAKLDQGINRQLVVLPTGSGKTVIFSELIHRKKLKTLVIAHRIELLQQAKDKLKKIAPDIKSSIFCGRKKDLGKQVTIASILSTTRALETLKQENFQLLIIDEAHHAPAKTYKKLIKELGFDNIDSDKRLLIGFTATPYRGDGEALNEIFQEIVYHTTIKKLVHRGYLVKPQGIHVSVGIDLRKVKKVGGDFEKQQLRKVMITEEALQVVVQTIKTQASDRRGIIFTVSIDHAKLLQKRLKKEKISCGVVYSGIDEKKRERTLKSFSRGKIKFITNAMILTEGFDCPVADCMINASPTQNRSLYIQKAGRVLRPYPEKEDALIIDFGYTNKKHALRTVIDLFGDAKLRKIRKACEIKDGEQQKNLTENTETVDDLKVGHVTKEHYDPLDPEKTGGIHHKWIRDKDEKRTVFYLTEGTTRIYLVRYHHKNDGWNVLRHRKSNVSEEIQKEYFGIHTTKKAFELGESLFEEVVHKSFKPKLSGKATEKQLNYLKVLMMQTRVRPKFDLEKLSKAQASKYIDSLSSKRYQRAM
uniref:ATP-dependent helicase IRC3 n=2 Tax=Candidatus Kentrum sp. SD TaxID=2126332 RepID=A0A450Z766_9GAMM|nr:MAG: ATP-dependent helicase IRC3 [Candidatus Kentron sp. SD]VFK49660.1 MAG: ATP-dependent helicase IRC3 [Candidatus Kentron sp. SD]